MNDSVFVIARSHFSPTTSWLRMFSIAAGEESRAESGKERVGKVTLGVVCPCVHARACLCVCVCVDMRAHS